MQKINKSNIIVLALLYNYITNKTTSLKVQDVERFFNELNYELFLREDEMISTEEREEQTVYHYNKKSEIEFFSNLRIPYSLIDIKREYIDVLPTDVIAASLSTNVLTSIKALREKIHTITCLEPKYILGNPNQPIKEKRSQVKHLRKPTLENQSEYKVHYFYSVEKTIINIDGVIEDHEKRLNLN